MINLLPIEEKQKIILNKKAKLTAVFGFVLFVSLVCLSLILISIKFYILAETDDQKNILAGVNKSMQTSSFVQLSGDVIKYNTVLDKLDSFYEKELYFNKALKTITDITAPKGLYIKNFSLKRGDPESSTVIASISGTSDTRENLLIYKRNIEEAKEIQNPTFSPESWVSQKNINFSLTFKLVK